MIKLISWFKSLNGLIFISIFGDTFIWYSLLFFTASASIVAVVFGGL